MKKKELKKILHRHKGWLKGKKWGVKADLSGADLHRADLRGDDLRGADLDFSCLPLWCGGQFIADERICKQLVAHTLRIMELSEIDEPELMEAMRKYKKGWHREDEFCHEKEGIKEIAV